MKNRCRMPVLIDILTKILARQYRIVLGCLIRFTPHQNSYKKIRHYDLQCEGIMIAVCFVQKKIQKLLLRCFDKIKRSGVKVKLTKRDLKVSNLGFTDNFKQIEEKGNKQERGYLNLFINQAKTTKQSQRDQYMNETGINSLRNKDRAKLGEKCRQFTQFTSKEIRDQVNEKDINPLHSLLMRVKRINSARCNDGKDIGRSHRSEHIENAPAYYTSLNQSINNDYQPQYSYVRPVKPFFQSAKYGKQSIDKKQRIIEKLSRIEMDICSIGDKTEIEKGKMSLNPSPQTQKISRVSECLPSRRIYKKILDKMQLFNEFFQEKLYQ